MASVLAIVKPNRTPLRVVSDTTKCPLISRTIDKIMTIGGPGRVADSGSSKG
jgi:hypothetical protein